jgi:hypothetical protein
VTVGVSVSTADAMLNSFGDVYVQMHVGDPGADGTSNIAAFSDRAAVDLEDAVAGVRSLAAPVEWGSSDVWVGSPQTVTHASAWSAPTGGSFLFSTALASHIDFVEGLRPRLQALSVAIPSIAAD